MSFQPVLPTSGYTGWRFLQRTIETQIAVYERSAPIQRATDYFRANIGAVRTAEDLVNNRQLLQVALGAFGLDEDIDSKFFIQKVLTDGVTSDTALANRLSDKRYAALSRAFGFGSDSPLQTATTAFADNLIERYTNRQFESAVGLQDDNLRLALNLRDGLTELLGQSTNERAHWFAVMGNQPLRRVFEGAMGLPPSFARIDIDQQLVGFQDRSRSMFGVEKVADFTDPAVQEKLVRLFLIRADAAAMTSSSSGSVALALLQAGRR